jgi:hypothetical protein
VDHVGEVFRYRLHTVDGDDIGDAVYTMEIKPGEQILFGNGRAYHVLDVAPFDEEDESPFVGMLKVEAA